MRELVGEGGILEGVIADQSVLFGALGQCLALEHRTTSRAAFAPGVLLAARAVTAAGAPFHESLEAVIGLPAPGSVRLGMASSAAP